MPDMSVILGLSVSCSKNVVDKGARLRVIDLFSGIGGFSLGLERAGMRTVAFCESDPYCQRVLAKHWPDVPVFGDVRELTAEALADAAPNDVARWRYSCLDKKHAECNAPQPWQAAGIDLICGGFPCQDISVAGKGAGIEGSRSGLWSEFARIIGEVRPRYVIVENVAALLGRGLGRVLGDLAALGYDAEWHCIPACAVGAPHRRDRVWIVGFANKPGLERREPPGKLELQRETQSSGSTREASAILADAEGARLPWRLGQKCARRPISNGSGSNDADADSKPTQRLAISWGECGQWLVEPDVGRVANGVPARVDRLRALGNSLVPQIAEIIGRSIMAAHI